jgi:hypothetical protein
MMQTKLFKGELVRLVAPEPEATAKLFKLWNRDTEYLRLLDSCPPRLWSQGNIQAWLERDFGTERPDVFLFVAHTLAEDHPIGFISIG